MSVKHNTTSRSHRSGSQVYIARLLKTTKRSPDQTIAMPTVHCIVFALALLAKGNALVASAVLGQSKLDEGRSEGDALSLLLGDEAPDDLMTPRRLSVQDNRLGDEDGATKIIILSDNGPGGFSLRSHQLRSVLGRAFPLLASWRMDQAAADWAPQEGHPEPDDNLSVRRRDMDVLRCMIGRVYRPCWQA
ncbi:pro-MCH isoform X2 [Alosa sapidissima]|uniref:pro-MCH isoform X2 n=2 Tax=Alosa TaxID=34772 RepID=UPI001C09F0F2|nr:pro-MCH isoform X2 [Alosa sapidissima]